MLALAPAGAVSDCVRRRVSEVKDRQVRLLGRRWPTSAHRRLLGWRLARDHDSWRMASVLGRDAPIDFYRLTTPSPPPASPGLPAFSCQRHGPQMSSVVLAWECYRAHIHALGNQQAGVRMTKLVEATNGHSLMEAEKAISLVT